MARGAAIGGAPHAGGFELVEQSPAGVATAGAQTADADGAAAVYYDPAALLFRAGLTVQGGASLAVYPWRLPGLPSL